jgi:pyruvate carboxylase subunit B
MTEQRSPIPPEAVAPLKITETSFRDGHQCTIATRMRTADLEAIAEAMDRAGFHSIEMWGGATFDAMTRFLAEDPWERLRLLKRLMPKTPFQMLLRGQNLVGYRNYPNDVVKAFIHHAAEMGIDIFRIFDALNDEWNLESSIRYVKECGKHAQGAVCFSVTEGRVGGPICNVDYFVKKALALQDMGVDSICLKDMAGMINPYDTQAIIMAFKAKLRVPIQLHTHYTSGMASMSVLKAAEAGIDAVDTCLAPMALRAAQPAVEPLVVTLRGTPRDTGLDLAYLLQLGAHFEKVLPKYRDFLDTTRFAAIDTNVLMHQIPGGMISNLLSQLREADALDRLPEVYLEIARTRADMGYPPLVTPSSQIVGVQAVNNVLFGRYKMITAQVKDYCFGLYGRPPAPINPDLVKAALKGYPGGEKPLTGKTADYLKPEMEKAAAESKPVARNLGDVLTYALYPTTGLRFLKWKYGEEAPPPETLGKSLEDIKREDELIGKIKAGKPVETPGTSPPAKSPRMRAFNVYVAGQHYKVEVDPADGGAKVQAPRASPAQTPSNIPAAQPSPSKSPPRNGDGPNQVLAPMPGIVIKYLVAEGAIVEAGQQVISLEAMKMENALPAPAGGKVRFSVKPGSRVTKGQVLAVIE